MTRRFIASLALVLCTQAQALNLGAASPSYDGIYYVTQYPNGDKPSGCTSISADGYTEANAGDAGGSICKAGSGDYTFAVSGTTTGANHHYGYKDGGGGDVQISGKILATYAGASANAAAVGVGIRETATAGSWLFECYSPKSGTAAVACKYGADPNYTTVNGASGQSRPRYVAVTYDVSLGDIKGFESSDGSTWLEVASTNRALSNDLAFFFGSSGSTTEVLTAEMNPVALGSTITAYTPGGGGGGGAPTLVSDIPNQDFTQGVAVGVSALCVAANFTTATSYAATGFPGSTGFTFNTSTGCLGGTPNANDRSAQPFNVNFTATNASGTSAAESSLFSIAPASGGGTTHTVSAAQATTSSILDCDTFDGGVDPGDVLEFTSATRAAVSMRDCNGTTSAPITIRKSASATQLVINSGSGSDRWRCENCTNLIFDGNVNWTGHTDGSQKCGANVGATGISDTPQTECGIKIVFNSQFGLKFRGASRGIIVRGVEIDGGGNGQTALSPHEQDYCSNMIFKTVTAASKTNPIEITAASHGFNSGDSITFNEMTGGFSALNANDYTITRTGANTFTIPVNGTGFASYTSGGRAIKADDWHSDFTIIGNYLHDVSNEVVYFGPNVNYGSCGDITGIANVGAVPRLKNIYFGYNYIEGGAWDGGNLKSAFLGTNVIEYNWIGNIGGGSNGSGANSVPFSCFEAECTMRFNKVRGASAPPGGAPGLWCGANKAPDEWGTLACEIYGNDVSDVDGPGINVSRNTNSTTRSALIYSNTVTDAGKQCINVADSVDGSVTVRDNLTASCTLASVSVPGGGSGTNNRNCTNESSCGFTDPNGNDYRISAGSPAHDQGQQCPSTDIKGTVRPKGAACDQGAYEVNE